MIRRIKQTGLGVLLLMAALFTGCAEDAVVEQQRWHVNIKADRQGDDALTRSLYLDGSSALKARWTGSEVLKVYNSSNVEVGTLTASANLTGGSTTLTGDLTADVSIGDKLYIWSPSNTPDYATQDGTVDGANGISAKDYIKAEIEVEAKDDANHILKTSDASFEHQQSFTKFSVTPAVHSLKISATGMSDITATLDGTEEGNDFYVALPNTGGSAKTFTLTGTTYADVAFTASKSKQLEDGKYYVAAMDLKGEGAATLSSSSVSYGSTTGNKTVTVSGNTGTVSASVTSGSGCSVSVSGTTITITRSTNNAFSATITVTIAASTNYNSTTKAISVSGTAVDPGVAVGSATSSHIGKIIGANGKIYDNVTLANQYSAARAMIVYVGSAGTADASSATYKGLAIALTDASTGSAWYGTNSSYSSTCVYQNSTFSNHYGYADMKGIANTNQMANKTGNCSSHTTHAAATAAKNYSSTVAVPANCSQWFLPTSGQWLRFFRISTLNLTWSDWGWAAGTGSDNFNKVNKMFTDAGASSAVFSSGTVYWSSSESNSYVAVYVGFNSSLGVSVTSTNKYGTYRVRAFLAF